VFQHSSEFDLARLHPWRDRRSPDPHAPIVWVAGTSDERILTSSHGTVKLWDPAHPREPVATFVGAAASAKTMTVSGNGLVLTGCRDDAALLWDPAHPGKPITRFPHGDKVTTLAAIGSELVLTGGSNSVKLWNQTSPQQPITVFTLDDELIAAAVTKEGRILLLDEAGTLHCCTLRGRPQPPHSC